MNTRELDIANLLTIDKTGMPVAPNIRQLQNKDVLSLYARDTSPNKERYKKEVGVIYYFADPKSPAKEQGLSDDETLKAAIENYDLPKNYYPDPLVQKLIKAYYYNKITEAGIAIEALKKTIHLSTIAANKITEQLNKKLTNSLSDEDINSTLSLISTTSIYITKLPGLIKELNTAYDNLRNEEESGVGRGKINITSSMDADNN